MRAGDLAKVVSGPGGIFHGRMGRVFRVTEDHKRTWIGLMFEDGGAGCDRGVPFWFEPSEVEKLEK